MSETGPRISACIIAMNEEDRIADCIRSLSFCAEVVVIDSHSTDTTRAVAGDLGARVIERDWPGHVAQKEFAIRQAKHDWVLCLDADERVSDPMRTEILALQARGFPVKAGWRMPRLSFYLGRWIRRGVFYPNHQLRLFDRRRGHWGGTNPHDRVELDGPVGMLRGDLLHHPYRSLGEHLRTVDKYTTIMARELRRKGKRVTVLNVIINPWVRFIRSYVLKRGFLDGWHGLVLAYIAAYYVRLKYLKALTMQKLGDDAL